MEYIDKKNEITFKAIVNDECFVGAGRGHDINTAFYIRIKPEEKIYQPQKDKPFFSLSNKMIKIPHWVLEKEHIPIPKENIIVEIKGYWGQAERSLNYYFVPIAIK